MTLEPTLLDAEAQHRLAPRTFSIPRRQVREALSVGDFAKLMFVVEPPNAGIEVERMWVEIVEVTTSGYVGRLDNDPRYLQGLRCDDHLAFQAQHVAAIHVSAPDPRFVDPAVFAVVSRRVWDEDAWPRRLERREVPDTRFSGWFVMAGDESAGFLADLANFTPIAQGTLFDRWRVLDSGLEGPVGTTMIWNEETVEFEDAPQH
jgi:hypothetical protein